VYCDILSTLKPESLISYEVMKFKFNYFPFTPRREQDRFLSDARTAINNGEILIAQAPTGLGKTSASLAPAVEYALHNRKKVFFATSKNSQHKMAIKTLRLIKEKFNLDLKVISLVGKQHLCPLITKKVRNFNAFCDVRRDSCKYHNNHKNQTNRAIKEIFDTPLQAEDVKQICMEYGACAHEVLTSIVKYADVVVCDYNHIFQPSIRELVLKGMELKDIILIVDEAHNLPQRARDLLSDRINANVIKGAIEEAKVLEYDRLEGTLTNILLFLRELVTDLDEDDEKYVDKEAFIQEIERITTQKLDDFIEMLHDVGIDVLNLGREFSYIERMAEFLNRWESSNGQFCRYIRDLELCCISLDPGILTQDVFSKVYSGILMSATLTPVHMYTELLGLPERTIEKEYRSPFPRENQFIVVTPDVTTRYVKRSDEMYQKYTDKIVGVVNVTRGNSAVFFPSYEFMNRVFEGLNGQVKKRILMEQPSMTKEEKEDLLNEINGDNSVLLLGVMGGSLSEGIDLSGNLLHSVIIVGIPLIPPNLEVKSLVDYYENKFNRGWDYGYYYPAMNKILQSAGRCIRSESDKAAIILMDERITWDKYRRCLPVGFYGLRLVDPSGSIDKFFEHHFG